MHKSVIMWRYTKWIHPEWYKYLFGELKGESLKMKWTKIVCRAKGHPCGPIWYSWGMEPNYHCKNCGDEI